MRATDAAFRGTALSTGGFCPASTIRWCRSYILFRDFDVFDLVVVVIDLELLPEMCQLQLVIAG